MTVGIIGGGNFGSAVSKIVGQNIIDEGICKKVNHEQVLMWVFEELIEGERLTDIINQRHENVKYLKGIALPHNIVASPSLAEVAGADLLVFVLPEQFLPRTLAEMKPHIRPGTKAISLIKGLVTDAAGAPALISGLIERELGLGEGGCAVMMGANLAGEIAAGQLCEATIGCKDIETGELFKALFHCSNFRVEVRQDVAGIELCGCLKNVIALGAGFCDGVGAGENTKAALIRRGLLEMRAFCRMFYGDGIEEGTFLESCGVADLVVTCYGGRNRRCGQHFAQQVLEEYETDSDFDTVAPVAETPLTRKGATVVPRRDIDKGSELASAEAKCSAHWAVLEEQLLGGQRLAGLPAARAVQVVLDRAQAVDKFPIMSTVYKIAFESRDPRDIIESIKL